MTLSQELANQGMNANATLQAVAGNPNVPAPVQAVGEYVGGNVQYISGPTGYFVLYFVGQDPNLPGT